MKQVKRQLKKPEGFSQECPMQKSTKKTRKELILFKTYCWWIQNYRVFPQHSVCRHSLWHQEFPVIYQGSKWCLLLKRMILKLTTTTRTRNSPPTTTPFLEIFNAILQEFPVILCTSNKQKTSSTIQQLWLLIHGTRLGKCYYYYDYHHSVRISRGL